MLQEDLGEGDARSCFLLRWEGECQQRPERLDGLQVALPRDALLGKHTQAEDGFFGDWVSHVAQVLQRRKQSSPFMCAI